jgi:hypothetical protein
MRWVPAVLLAACTGAQSAPPAGSLSPTREAERLVGLVPAIVEAVAPSDQTPGLLLIDVRSFVAGGEMANAGPITPPAIARTIRRDFRDVPLQNAILQRSQNEYRIVDDGVHIHLDTLQRHGTSYQAVVTRRDTYVHGPQVSSIGLLQVRLTFIYEDGRWALKDKQVLLVS